MSPIRVGTDHRVQRAGGIGGAAAEFDGDCPVLQLKLTFSGRPTEAPAVGVEHLRIRIRGACAKGLTNGWRRGEHLHAGQGNQERCKR